MTERKITGDYIAGFVDGEGCFSLTYRKDKGKYFYWKALFAIALRDDELEILEQIKKYFECGSIGYAGNNVRYQITNDDDLENIIVPFFEKYKLIGKKKHDFELWKESLSIIIRNKRKDINARKGIRGFIEHKWNKDDLLRLKYLRDKMQKYKGGGRTRTFKY